VFKFAGLAALASTTLSATIGVGALAFSGLADGAETAAIWLTWWLGDAAGAMVATPLLLAWHANHSLRPASAPRLAEALLLFGTVASATSLLFFVPLLGGYPLAFLCLPPLVWAAFRFSTREVATAVAAMAIIATWATASGRGPFVMTTTNESLLVLQAFLTMFAMTALVMAALVRERAALLRQVSAELDNAQGALRTSDVFLAMLSHELRNPLAAIASAAAVIENVDAASESAARARRIVKRQAAHVTRLLDDLLDVARITAGKITLQRRRLDLAEAVESYVASLPDLPDGLLELALESAWIDGDADRLDQIIGNLLHNARKFTAAGGRIRVRTCTDGPSSVLLVEDTGAGIAPDLLPRVFDLFTQGEQGLDRADGGLGVGLALVQRLVMLHGGSIEARSRGRGLGSAFGVSFPAAAAATAPAPAPVAVAGLRPAARRILLIEDNDDARESLRLLLAGAGHETYEAADGETGVRLASQLAPEVVLVDLGLPGIDGYEAARRIRAAHPAIRLIALTGYGRDDDRARSRSAGFDAHLVKPVDFARLHDLL
jgi:signal transduction histidine kinase